MRLGVRGSLVRIQSSRPISGFAISEQTDFGRTDRSRGRSANSWSAQPASPAFHRETPPTSLGFWAHRRGLPPRRETPRTGLRCLVYSLEGPSSGDASAPVQQLSIQPDARFPALKTPQFADPAPGWPTRSAFGLRNPSVRFEGQSPQSNKSGLRGSNPSNWLGKPGHYHYAKPAAGAGLKSRATSTDCWGRTKVLHYEY